MDVEALLDVQPDLLVRLILHRRERLAESIPALLNEARSALNQTVAVASSTKRARDASASMIERLQRERDGYVASASELLGLGVSMDNASFAAVLDNLRTHARDAEQTSMSVVTGHLDAAQKAELARQTHAEELDMHSQAFSKADAALRRADSRVQKLTNALRQCEEAITYWQAAIASGIDASHPLQREAQNILATSGRSVEGRS